MGSLILWLGPALGAWFALRMASQNQQANPSVQRAFLLALVLEHIALLGLLSSGAALAWYSGQFSAPWLVQKLWLIGLIIVPLELVDMVIGHRYLPKILARQQSKQALSSAQRRQFAFYHGPFTHAAIIVLPFTVIAIMWLAISKTPLIS
ncbi:MAG: hypothetical protein OIF35_13415 [Cellvibrionaceae bacterium]|nr:hypothetical protein [Cellvibrionaceae bacterium]MCV6625439.1 hypothetical protein [Cellvibrionaceae bacterium]